MRYVQTLSSVYAKKKQLDSSCTIMLIHPLPCDMFFESKSGSISSQLIYVKVEQREHTAKNKEMFDSNKPWALQTSSDPANLCNFMNKMRTPHVD